MDNHLTIIAQLAETYYSSCSSSSNSLLSESSTSEDTVSSSSNDEEDVLLFPLMQYLTTGKKRCRVDNYLRIIDSWTDHEFKEHLRLHRNTANCIIDELEASRFIPAHTFGVRPLTAKLSFLIFLWYISNTEPLRTISDRFDVSISSVFRVLRRVVSWLLTKLDTIITWPQGNEVLAVAERFSAKQGIPSIVGAIDGTHIRIEKPALQAEDYCNRKKFYSISLQAVATADMCFTNVYCGEPGARHDARVFRRSELFHTASLNQGVLFPHNTFLLGDSAYPSLSWLVPPFRDNGHLTPEQTEFNYVHSSTRMVIERAFGQLKGRFRRIKFFTEYRNLSFIVDTVVAACILHNYCIRNSDTYDFPQDEDNDGVDMNPFEQEGRLNNRIMQRDRRNELFREMFPNPV